jgi:hypothetical protein
MMHYLKSPLKSTRLRRRSPSDTTYSRLQRIALRRNLLDELPATIDMKRHR